MRRGIISFAGLAAVAIGLPAAGSPYNGLAPIAADPAIMALAKKAAGTKCRFEPDKIGPQVPGFANLPGVGQTVQSEGMVFVRQRGGQRVAFMAREGDKGCRIIDVQPLPPRAKAEAFLQCRVDNPDADIIAPLSEGLGLRQNGRRALAAYLETQFATALIPRAGDDSRIHCSEFESGD